MEMQSSSVKSTDGYRFNYLRSLRFSLLPLVVLGLANFIFELVAFDLNQLLGDLIHLVETEPALANDFIEARARLIWATTLFIFYAALICVSIFSVLILRRSLTRGRQAIFVVGGSVIALLVIGHLLYSASVRNNFSHIFFFTFEVLVASNRYSPSHLGAIKTLVFTLNGLAALVPVITLLSGCCVLSHDRDYHMPQLERLVSRMRRLKRIINGGSFLLVAGILHMIAWLRWPAVLTGDSAIAKSVTGFSEAMGIYWGAVFSLIIAAFYLPAALSINRRAEAILGADTDQVKGNTPHEWLQTHGLSIAPMQQLPQVAAILAPLLAGPVGSTITTLAGSYAGG